MCYSMYSNMKQVYYLYTQRGRKAMNHHTISWWLGLVMEAMVGSTYQENPGYPAKDHHHVQRIPQLVATTAMVVGYP